MKAIIVCNGNINDYKYCKQFFSGADYIIAADGGAAHLCKMGIRPDVLLGDFDSLEDADLTYYKDQGIEIIQFPVEKDMTDSELAINVAVEKGFKKIIMLGATGSRLDHTMANMMMLKMMLDNGVEGWIINENNRVTIIKDRIELSRQENTKVTLLALTKAVGVTLEGFYYPLDNVTLDVGTTWGVSNEFSADKGIVTIKSGLLFVILSQDIG